MKPEASDASDSRLGFTAVARAALRSVLPGSVRQWLRSRYGWRWFRGDYATWSEAAAASEGYATDAILSRVLAATLAVQKGEAAFERDGVLFASPSRDETLIQALETLRSETHGRLRVLDFGGSLGSTYWRLREHLPEQAIEAWDIVEQPSFVAAGRRHITEPRLRFFEMVAEAELAGTHHVLLCATALQYLEAPQQSLAEWKQMPIPFLLLHNLPLHADSPTRLRVQHVPPAIYPGSYPVWFFNRREFLGWLERDYVLVREYASEAVWPVDGMMYPSTGLLLRKRNA